MAKRLQLVADKEDLLLIYTFGSDTPKETSSPSVEVNVETKRGITRKIQVNVVPLITDRIPAPEFTLNAEFDVMADDKSVGEGIDLLIGNDYYISFMRNRNVKIQDYLFLIDTDFGWVLTGSADVSEEREGILSVVTYCQCHDPERLYFALPDLPIRDTDMKFLWALESIGITDSAKTTREEEAVKHFTETVQYENGRYQVKWPWIEYPPVLPTNFGLAYGRLKSVFLRLDEQTLNEYKTILEKQLCNGIIEVIDPQTVNVNQPKTPVHYLAHHMVKVKGKDGRIVYDASARVKEQRSLNESLYKGPSMLEDLVSLLIKFRTDKIGITADVEKAFLQVGLQNADRDVTRFLWLKDTQKEVSEDNLLHLRFCRVPFGIISSPFLLTATIRHHLSITNKELLLKVADRCYVDNLVTTASTTSSACDLFHETRKSFQELSMNIRDWISNDNDFMKTIPEELRAKDTKVTKVLGLMWNLEDDSLQLKLNNQVFNEINEASENKRSVLRTLASFYDPCGFFSPLVLPAKILMQDLWRLKLSWDSPLPDDLLTRWKSIVTMLQTAKDIRLPRYIGLICSADEIVDHELHCFTDASKHAHAAVVYIRTTSRTGSKTTLLMSKSRVNPVKEKEDLKIPRLELLGYVIGSRLLSYVRNTLDIPVKKQVLWTDSLVVLSWVKSNKLLPPFVARRVNEIKQNPKLTMRYINTEQNPADVATRPEMWSQKKLLWLQGPTFLSDANTPWPDETPQCSSTSLAAEGLDVEYPERPRNSDEKITQEMESNNENIVKEPGDPQLQEIINLQREYFSEEVSGKETHLSRNLGLFLDVDGLLRCKGRMTHTDWSYEMKHPILLPKDSNYTAKVIKEIHEKNYHVGVAHTLSIIRQKFWIPQGRAQVQKVLKKCPQCVKHGGGPYALPPTPALPPERVTFSQPFTYTGIDYFGPMYVNTQQGKKKRWICLFTCLVVRAIHLEVVNDLTAQECLLALRRFVASKGIPTRIVSDNALQFKLTSEVLGDAYCSQNNIHWKFIPQLAPWHGAVYERLVAVVKHCLKRTLEKHLLVDSQLITVIKEVENVCNTRPLTYVGTELEHILTPADFLSLGKCLEIELEDSHIPTANTSAKQNLIEGWKRGQRIMSEFKSMFIGQYLSSLRERYHHSHKQPRVKSKRVPRVGDVVQLKDSVKNRENWKVGKISSLENGPDGECRVARVKIGNTEFTRSIGHLYPLETEIIEEHDMEKTQAEEHVSEQSQDPDLEDEMTRPDGIPLREPIAERIRMVPNNWSLVEEHIEKEQQRPIVQTDSVNGSSPLGEVIKPQVPRESKQDEKRPLEQELKLLSGRAFSSHY
ncbi:uncharacterized protein [Choristoneura fumiferana]|uniref:uncharacterized protein n=1 Tax=Choristoneura fumiferana TaxID=7141 RepID=UPI003D15EC69